ncbi:MAG: glycerol kinase GlpK [Acidimicrobiia bacterium]|nr:glycerol kinase GlpK [Acidimicrobiia bacterium]MDH3396522.1 glycerol kinase GlpK [Acidimicrobiia bacterium]
MGEYVGALDQGTTSTRFMVFNHSGQVVSAYQEEHKQIFPQPGWVEHDAAEIWDRSRLVIDKGLERGGLRPSDLVSVGITNQRETVVVWERSTGKPIHNAIVWQDTRTAGLCNELAAQGGPDRFRSQTGLPLATYFSGPKVSWLLDHLEGARSRAESGELLFGTIDSWELWNLTGGPSGGRHLTDVTNASRTLLMNLATLDWDDDLLGAVGVPRAMLPEIHPSSEIYGRAVGVLEGVPIAGILGDQQAALFGQVCFDVGEAKNTYGTGCFMLLNTGSDPVTSQNGLLTTVAYQVDGEPAIYALEGSIAIAGALVQWLRDNLEIIDSAAEVEALARSVADNGGVYFVPAFSGLFAPHWRSDARGVIAGLTRFATKGHLARAALEATAFQTREVLDAMNLDSGVELTSLKVDGGMVYNDLLMQFQADQLGVPVLRPVVAETTALGAACAAGLAVGYWDGFDDLKANWGLDRAWQPVTIGSQRDELYARWKKTVNRTLDWV